jgi:hypothetical protein
MAEGLLESVPGDDAEKAEWEAPNAPTGAEAFAAAIAAIASRQAPQVAQDTSAFLKKQTQLLETQRPAARTLALPVASAARSTTEPGHSHHLSDRDRADRPGHWASASSPTVLHLKCPSLSVKVSPIGKSVTG